MPRHSLLKARISGNRCSLFHLVNAAVAPYLWLFVQAVIDHCMRLSLITLPLACMLAIKSLRDIDILFPLMVPLALTPFALIVIRVPRCLIVTVPV